MIVHVVFSQRIDNRTIIVENNEYSDVFCGKYIITNAQSKKGLSKCLD